MFDPEKKAEGLDSSTFDIVKIDAFHNTRFWTVLSFLWVWIVLISKIAILAGDTYTCVSILVFNRWSTLDYNVYEYKIAKWIFAGCILFRFLLLAYQIAWGIHIYRTRNIALAYLNNYARLMYAIRSYNYQCLFHEIDQEGFFEWACFHVYTELDNALEVLVADLPRQVINFMTLRFYATGGEMNNDILVNIRWIATTNLRLSIILSFQLCTMVLFLYFFFKFLLAIILYIPIKVKVANKGFRLLKAFCYRSVNNNVRFLVRRNHKPRTQILNEGLMNAKEIQENSLLGSTSTFDTGRSFSGDTFGLGYFSAPKSNRSAFYDQSLGSLSLGNLALKDSLATNLWDPLLRSYDTSSLRENPFVDVEASIPDRDKFMDNVEVNPFADPGINTPENPVRIAPPVRSQTSESLHSRRMIEGSMLKSGGITDHEHRWQNNDVGITHYDSTASLLNHGKEHILDTTPLQENEGDMDSSLLEGSDKSDGPLSPAEHADPGYLGLPPSELDRNVFSENETTRDTQADGETPYPVRGVSLYFEGKTDV